MPLQLLLWISVVLFLPPRVYLKYYHLYVNQSLIYPILPNWEHVMDRTREEEGNGGKKLMLNYMLWTYHHDCQNSSKSLLYKDRSWISRLATCQLMSWDWNNLHKTNPAGKIHHSLSSLHACIPRQRVRFSQISSLLTKVKPDTYVILHGWMLGCFLLEDDWEL